MFKWPYPDAEKQACRDKFVYKTRREARRYGKWRWRVEGLPKLQTYKCPYCAYYHHQKRRNADAR